MNALFYNHQILELFLSYDKSCFLERAPMFYDELNNCDVLFVGINPSFIDLRKSYQFIQSNCLNDARVNYLQQMKELEYNNLYFKLEDVSKNIQILGDIHAVFKNNYSYFKKFKLIQKQINVSVEHLDLFPIRETSQNKVSKIIEQNTEFRSACLKIFISTVKKMNPKAIVIENTLARDILIKQNDLALNEYFPSYNFEHFKNNGIGTPVNKFGVAVYYTSMLTGQRAIDLGSFNRLLWSLNKFIHQN